MGKSLLIINYNFPPSPGIGGRRWAKFAKYLALDGYKIDVITAENRSSELSFWNEDVKHPNITLHYLPVKYPSVLLNGVSGFFDKITFHLWKWALTMLSQGTVFERSFFWKNQLVKKAMHIINENKIKNIVVTVPPFRLAYYSTFLKKLKPEINLITDFRDPWTNNESFHGFKDLSARRLEYEKKMEMDVLIHSDKIVSVARHTTAYLKEGVGKESAKFFTIPNGYDPADIAVTGTADLTDKITFVHMGTVYSNLEFIILPLLECISEIKSTNNSLYKKLNFEFYGTYGLDLKKLATEKGLDCFSVNSPVLLKDAMQKIAKANYCLLFAAPDHGFAFNTKFYEYIGCRKPIVLFSNKGDASEYIETNKIGICIDPLKLKEELLNTLSTIEKTGLTFDSAFDSEQFSVKNLTESYKKLFVN